MKIIAGLGNPGREYWDTRHNIGYMVADELARRWGVSFSKADRGAECAEYRAGEKVLLIKPVTYMSLSGRAVAEYANFYKVAPEDIAVIYDDMDLPAGYVRIRKKGGSGGHNGINSILEHLGTDEFPRFRIGIGHPVHDTRVVINYVLTPFSEGEKEAVEKAVKTVADAVEMWLKEDMDFVMQEYNKKPARGKPEKEEEKKKKMRENHDGKTL
ncbi:MAG: aminoacyl-tRNA hydrolase [Phascolarctobacterium sp.]|nr:aminoacyl-tRNA hydrolase [Phascolarctobacterium sp.]